MSNPDQKSRKELVEKYKDLAEGLDISDRSGEIPLKLVEKLDLVYYSGHKLGMPIPFDGIELEHSQQYVGGINTKIRNVVTPKKHCVKIIVSYDNFLYGDSERTEVVMKAKNDERLLNRLFIFGAVLEPILNNFAATPIFCLDKKPEGNNQNHLGATRFQGLYPTHINDDSLINIEQNNWGGAIDVHADGTASVFFGNACNPSTADAIIFDELIPFDLEKRLIFARSPNSSIKLDRLHKLQLPEGDRTFEYVLIYNNINSLKNGKTYAIYYDNGIKWENNPILDGLLEHYYPSKSK